MKLKSVLTALIATAVFQAALVHASDKPSRHDISGNITSNRVQRTSSTRGGGIIDVDQRFVTQATQAGVFEIQLGQLAAQNSSNASVVVYGQQLIDDHTAANQQLAEIATTKGFELPADLDRAHARTLDRLSRLSGDRFDRAFARIAVSSHQQSIRLFENESRHGQDIDLQVFAEADLALLQQHLTEAKQIMADLRGKK